MLTFFLFAFITASTTDEEFAARTEELADAAQALYADERPGHELDREVAREYAAWAQTFESEFLPGEYILAIIDHESGYDPLAAPRGKWPVDPKTPPKRRHYICGVMQATVHIAQPKTKEQRLDAWYDCIDMRTPVTGVMAGVTQIEAWERTCKRMGWRSQRKIRDCALSGYGPGTKAARAGTSSFARWCRWAVKRMLRDRKERARSPRPAV